MSCPSTESSNERIDLLRKRNRLFENFLENPKKIYLAVEIRRLDDELFGQKTDGLLTPRRRPQNPLRRGIKRPHFQ